MHVILRQNFQPVSGFEIFFRKKTQKRGHKLYSQGHVYDVTQCVTLNKAGGKCMPQMKIRNSSYVINLQIDKDNKLKSGHCTCKAGIKGMCKHAAAVVWYINHEKPPLSCTSVPQAWGKPSGLREEYSQAHKLCDLFPSSRNVISTTTVESADRFVILDMFPDISCPMMEALKAERTMTRLNATLDSELSSASEDILEKCFLNRETFVSVCDMSEHYSSLTLVQQTWYKHNIECDSKKLHKLCLETADQAKCVLWHSSRKIRISASSTPHRVKTCVESKLNELSRKVTNEKSFSNEHMRYGQATEECARITFKRTFNVSVLQCGLFVYPEMPYLCCSPDGIVLDEEPVLLEIKCPSVIRNSEIIGGDMAINVPYLKFDDRKLTLKPSHKYYTQIQISMYVLNLQKTYLFVYTKKDHQRIIVTRDDKFLQTLIPKLTRFYFRYLIPLYVS